MARRFPNGYYDAFDNLADELLRWISDHGRKGIMPTASELKASKRYDLRNHIFSAKHGGHVEIARRLNLEIPNPQRPHGYWQKWSNVEREILEACQHLSIDRIPTTAELRGLNSTVLTKAIQAYGGPEVVAKRMKLRHNRRRRGGWTLPVILDRARSYAQQRAPNAGMFTLEELMNDGQGDLASAISRLKLSMNAIASELGFEPRQTEKGYWNDIDNLKRELLAFSREHGLVDMMPTQDLLRQHNRHDLIVAIYRVGGGMTALADTLGLRCNQVPKGHWLNFSNVEAGIRSVMNQIGLVGEMPTPAEIVTLGSKSLAHAISNHFDGFPAVAERLGLLHAVMLGQTSRDEIYLAHELSYFFANDVNDHLALSDGRFKADIIIREHRTVIEYDGYYFHAHRLKQDLLKTAKLNAAGWKVVRVREEPLDLIGDYDVTVVGGNYKQTANLVLNHLQVVLRTKVPGIRSYLKRTSLINKEKADLYLNSLRQKQVARRSSSSSSN